MFARGQQEQMSLDLEYSDQIEDTADAGWREQRQLEQLQRRGLGPEVSMHTT